MQRDKLQGNAADKPKVYYMGAYHNDDSSVMEKTQQTLTGRVMSQWWDCTDEAGPQKRPNCQFSVPLPTLEVLAIADGKVKILKRKWVVEFQKNNLYNLTI